MKAHPEIKKILVPVPLTSDFITPLKQAIYFHEVYGSKILLMNVVPDVSVFHRVLRPEKLRNRNKKALKKLKKMTKSFFGGEIPPYMNFRIANGELISAILKSAEKFNSDLIIIKKAGRMQGLLSFFRKENADKLIAESICPVLTLINKPTEHGIRNILIPVDITKKTTNKVAWAISLAKKFKAKIHVVSVQNLDIKLVNSLSYKKSLIIEENIKKEGLDVSMVLLKSDNQAMEDIILSHASSLKPDLFLIMTHQESILFDNYLGNFASKLIHKSPIPVFSVVPRKETLIDGLANFSDLRRKQWKSI